MPAIDPSGILRSPDGETSPVGISSNGFDLMLNMRVDPAAMQELENYAPGGDISKAVSLALALFLAAAKASREGKHVGIAGEAGKLDVEFVGF